MDYSKTPQKHLTNKISLFFSLIRLPLSFSVRFRYGQKLLNKKREAGKTVYDLSRITGLERLKIYMSTAKNRECPDFQEPLGIIPFTFHCAIEER